jgi:hypothetical protein
MVAIFRWLGGRGVGVSLQEFALLDIYPHLGFLASQAIGVRLDGGQRKSKNRSTVHSFPFPRFFAKKPLSRLLGQKRG